MQGEVHSEPDFDGIVGQGPVFHGRCYCRVAHCLHHCEQVLRGPVHFSSEAVTSTVQNQVIR